MKFKWLLFKALRGIIFFVLFLKAFFVLAVDDSKRASIADSLRAVELYQNGALGLKLGDFESAVSYFEESINLVEKIFGKNSTRMFSSLVSLGVSYKNQGEYEKAIDSYLKAEKLVMTMYSEDNPRLSYVYLNLGNIYKLRGDFMKNHEYQSAALRVLPKHSLEYSNAIITAEYNISESLFLLKKYDDAIISCIRNSRNLDDDKKSFYYSLLARIYNELGNQELTKQYYQKTFEILTKLKGAESYDLGLEYTNYSTFLLKTGEFDEALKYAGLSEKLVAKYFTKNSLQYSDVMLNFADYYFMRSSAASDLAGFQTKRKADLAKALAYYQQALIAGNDGFTSAQVTTNPTLGQAVSEIQVLGVLKKKAQCLETLADLNLSVADKTSAVAGYQNALQAISLATELVHQIRMGYVSEDSKFFLAENQEATFMDAVNISYKLFQQTNDQHYAGLGFEFAEKSKSASFLAAVKDSKAKEFGGIPDSLLKREDYLKLNISNYREMLFEENQNDSPDSLKIALYNSKIFQLNEQYAQLVQLFEQSYPNYYSFKYQNEVVDIERIRKKISGRSALVEYLIEEPANSKKNGQIFKFVITNKEVVFTKEVIDTTFVNDIESVYQFLTSSDYLFTGLGEFKTYAKSAFRLYEVLLKKEQDLLKGKELIIIPDDKLAYVPFDALLYEMPDTTAMNFRKLPYLVSDYSISYTYSATLLFNYFGKEKTASNDLLAFAPSYVSDNRAYTASAEFRAGLLPLPAVNKEVESIRHYIKGDIFKDSAAQESTFKNLAADYDILHLAMHTIINDTLPMYSKLAFSRPISDDPDDGWLSTSEIYTMALKARMAVLSACNTGSGRLQKGEGVMSLARGFLYAGCPSIVMTLWEVEDESGANIMKDFYRFLSKGKSKNESLRAAKLAHIQNADPLKAHPHYWLGYVVVGNPDPLYRSNHIYFILAVLGVVFVLFADHFFRKKKARD